MISLIVATLGRSTELDRLLSSLEDQTYRDLEVIVVDQNSDDRVALVLSRYPRLQIQRLCCEQGLSKARNVGLRIANGDIIAIPDDDCWYPGDLLESVVRWFSMNPESGLLSMALRTADNQPSGPNSPKASCWCTKSNVWRCAVSTAIFMRSSVCSAVGRFNENLGIGAPSEYQSGEETDYVLRALEHGFQMWYESSLIVHHPPLQSIERLQKTTYPFALGSGCILRIHGYPLHQMSGQLIRSLGGAALNLCRGDFAKAQVYLLRGAGQFVGYMSGPRGLRRAMQPQAARHCDQVSLEQKPEVPLRGIRR
jgi:glycosyltransferase involved in cell wall biosynthesis